MNVVQLRLLFNHRKKQKTYISIRIILILNYAFTLSTYLSLTLGTQSSESLPHNLSIITEELPQREDIVVAEHV